MHDFSVDRVQFLQRIDDVQKRAAAESARQKEQRRVERAKGLLPDYVRKGLRNCNVPQLLKAKKLCDEYIRDQREAPDDGDCDKPFIVRVLLSVPHGKERYRYEIIRSSKKTEKIYINGPYWYRYWRDGKVIHRPAVGKKNEGRLPRSVKKELRKYAAEHDVNQVLEQVRANYLP
jgi:hypothetical protein